MAHILRAKKPLLTRVRRIQGQAQALERAIDADDECLAVLQQIAALRGAVNGLMAEVLDGHLREHLGAHGLSEAQRTEEVEAVAAVLRSYLK
jgi:DNA-binding FrmR family transcriptional regulator